MKNPFQKSRIPEGKAFLIRELKAPFFDVSWHFHTEYQLFVVLKGTGTRFVGDHMQNFREGDMVLTGPDRTPDGVASLLRAIWWKEGPEVREKAERSIDGGKTWTPVFDIVFRPHR